MSPTKARVSRVFPLVGGQLILEALTYFSIKVCPHNGLIMTLYVWTKYYHIGHINLRTTRYFWTQLFDYVEAFETSHASERALSDYDYTAKHIYSCLLDLNLDLR